MRTNPMDLPIRANRATGLALALPPVSRGTVADAQGEPPPLGSSKVGPLVEQARRRLSRAWLAEELLAGISKALHTLVPSSTSWIGWWKVDERRFDSLWMTPPPGVTTEGGSPLETQLEQMLASSEAVKRLDRATGDRNELLLCGFLYPSRPPRDDSTDVALLMCLAPAIRRLVLARRGIETSTITVGLDEVLEHLPTPAFVTTPDGWVVLANRTARQVWAHVPDWLPSGRTGWTETLPRWVDAIELGLGSGARAWLLLPDSRRVPLEEAHLTPWARSWCLSPRFAQVALLLSRGLCDKEIADRLDLTWSTTRTYVARILKATGVHSRSELIARIRAVEAGVR